MHFYLANWVGDGTEGNEYRPNIDAGSWAAIDFRPDSTVLEGRVLVATDQPLDTIPNDVDDLGDLLDEALNRPNIRGIEQRLGVTLQGQSLRQIIAELLIVHGETDLPGRTRWKRLQHNHIGRHVIRLLGEILFDAPAVEGAVITESFNKADNGLGPDLPWTVVSGTIGVRSNQARAITGSGTARAEVDLDSSNHYAVAEDHMVTVNTNRSGVVARWSPSKPEHYRFLHWRDGSGSILEKVVDGNSSQIASFADGVIGGGGKLFRIEADGSVIRGIYDSVEYVSTTDTDITGNLRCGLVGLANGSERIMWDNFEAGDLPVFGPPTDVVAQASSPTEISVSWDGVEGADAHDIERDGVIVHRAPASGGTGRHFYTDIDREPGTKYSYRVRPVRWS